MAMESNAKLKPLSRHQLIERNVQLHYELDKQRREAGNLKFQLDRALEKTAPPKPDLSMVEARIKLLSQLGQLVEATSKAVVWAVGKEQL